MANRSPCGRPLAKALLPLIVTVTLLGACRRTATQEEVRRTVVGKWHNPDGSCLVIQSDGTFLAHALPMAVFGDPDDQKQTFEGSGTWELSEWEWGWDVHLIFAPDGEFGGWGTSVSVSNDQDHPHLYGYEGDPDNSPKYRLERDGPQNE